MDSQTTRRDFLRKTCPAAALLALGLATGCDSGSSGMDDPDPDPVDQPSTGIQVSGNTITLDLTGSQASRVASAGGFLLISAASTAIVNLDGTTIRAFSSICNHQNCDVSSFNGEVIICPCHGSRFSTTGSVVQGPATRALQAFDVQRNGDIVTITTA